MAFSPCRNPRCGLSHDPMLRCEVAARLLSSPVPARVIRDEAAINNANSAADAINGVTNGRTGNRRTREDYNAYMKGYMRRRRERARAGLAGGAA